MRITRVYTRQGDDGRTQIVSGERVWKDSVRVEAYGEVDELNSLIGFARSYIGDGKADSILREVQNDLFKVGSDLATPMTFERAIRVSPDMVEKLEKWIDELNSTLEPLRDFILPSGSKAGALLHYARTVCRRAERRVVSLMKEEEVNPSALKYVNRLSDLLFVMARYVNRLDGEKEDLVQWK